MDYRYETRDEARNFHKRRIAFIIVNNSIEFLPKESEMSHFEYCQTNKNLSKEEFNSITRGYYIDGNLVFYKDNFIYDQQVIIEGLSFLEQISNAVQTTKFEIYFGLKLDQNFAFDFHYGSYNNGTIDYKKEEII